MIIHSFEECEQWVKYKNFYQSLTKSLAFEVRIDNGDKPDLYHQWHLADIGGKSFQHPEGRIVQKINQVAENYPQLKPIIENLHIFMCPKPSADTANACANDQFITYFARATQIPWCMTDYITGHELGHVIEYKLCYHRNNDKFREYLELRNAEKGICRVYDFYDNEKKESIYADKEDFLYLCGTTEQKEKYYGWDNNPQEWFAEDFRYFFGVDQGEPYWGHPIPKPDERIKEFFLSL